MEKRFVISIILSFFVLYAWSVIVRPSKTSIPGVDETQITGTERVTKDFLKNSQNEQQNTNKTTSSTFSDEFDVPLDHTVHSFDDTYSFGTKGRDAKKWTERFPNLSSTLLKKLTDKNRNDQLCVVGPLCAEFPADFRQRREHGIRGQCYH